MEPMNLLLVERNSDWTEWQSISKLLGGVVLVLVQQSDEPFEAFHKRITHRLSRTNTPRLNRVVLLRDKDRRIESNAARDSLVRSLSAQAQQSLQIYPAAGRARPISLSSGKEQRSHQLLA